MIMRDFLSYSKDSEEVKYLCEKDELFSYAVNYIGTIEYTLHDDAFRHFVDTIIGQMLSNKVGDVISGRFAALCDNEITPERVVSLTIPELRAIGLSNAKSEYILNFAHIVSEKPSFFQELELKTDDEIRKELMAIKGIGIWSTNMYLLFVLGRPDILPTEDGAFAQAVKWLYGYDDHTRERKSLRKLLSHWSPYSSVASRYMYRLLDSGITKTEKNIFVENKGNVGGTYA